MDTQTADVQTSTDTQTVDVPTSTAIYTTDVPTSTDTVERTTCGNVEVDEEDVDEEDVDEEDVDEEDVDEEEIDNSAHPRTIYIVRVNDIISGFSYKKAEAVQCVKFLARNLMSRRTFASSTHMEDVSDTCIRIYESYRFMYLLSYDKLVYRITCEASFPIL